MAKRAILGLSLEGDDTGTAFKNLYSGWRDSNSESKESFLQLFTSFRDRKILADLDGGALKLYLYYCFAAKNLTGESWYSVEKITEYFGKQQKRTIEKWNKELREKELIHRERIDKKSHTTFLIPYSNVILDLEPPQESPTEDQGLLDYFIERLKRLEVVYGQIIGVYHLFQWVKKKGGLLGGANKHFLFIVTKRGNEVVIGHRYELSDFDEYGVSRLDFGDAQRFESPFRWDNQHVQGLAFEHTIRLLRAPRSAMKAWLELTKELADNASRIYTLQALEYGLTAEVLEDEQEDDDTDDQSE
ncbi:hypothetical protein [Paenibacillus soyae]|uniref:Uncharacterized protein n=1 Tax=Paenibacillus soyae TaxID=2969249 RepID=A0A9X2MV50_9BACL|nr:hypothetical protein [Paenibacillus soyae]MCR2807120.1 hypothetical protein [Paenibacillus soyae]